MSGQRLINSFFKSNKVITTPCLQKNIKKEDKENCAEKRRSSLMDPGSPCKSVKVEVDDKIKREVIDLCSDDDVAEPPRFGNAGDTFVNNSGQDDEINAVLDLRIDSQIITPSSSSSVGGTQLTIESTLLPSDHIASPPEDNSGDESAASQGTIVYNSPNHHLTPQKRRFSQTPQTPRSSELGSPQSGKKYFSPSKESAVHKKISVRNDLNQQLANSHSSDNDEYHKSNELLNNACDGSDEETVFLTIVHECTSNSSLLQLLAEESQKLLTKCLDIRKPGITLVCRLYWHKQGWYKMEEIKPILSENKIDDPTLQAILDSIYRSGFVAKAGSAGTDGYILTFADYSAILSADDLKQICKDLKLKTSRSKQEAIANLTQFIKQKPIADYMNGNTNDNTISVLKKMNQKTGPCYKLSDLGRKTIHELYILMYLGINYKIIWEKKLKQTLFHDKTKQKTYPVGEAVLDNASVVFRNRNEFERYVKAHNTHEEYLAEDVKVKCETVMKVFETFKHIRVEEVLRLKSLPPWLRRFTPLHLYISILEAGVQDLKRVSRYRDALEILDALTVQDMCRLHKKAEWFAEKALVLQKCERFDEAAKVLLEAFKANPSEESKNAMRLRAKQLATKKRLDLDKKLKTELLDYANREEILEMDLRATHIYKQSMEQTQKQGGKLKFETQVGDELVVQDVEEFCVTHLINSGEFTHGIHCKGRLTRTIYFLLFWDIIYSKPAGCPGVFLTRVQEYPLDMFCESFYENRKDAIEARLALIRDSSDVELVDMMWKKWTRLENLGLKESDSEPARAGAQPGTVRCGLTFEQAWGAAQCAGARGLAALCARLARDFRHADSGFPDLALWNAHTQKIRFVKVETDTVKSSMKQIQWMHYLKQNGLDAEFCHVGVNSSHS